MMREHSRLVPFLIALAGLVLAVVLPVYYARDAFVHKIWDIERQAQRLRSQIELQLSIINQEAETMAAFLSLGAEPEPERFGAFFTSTTRATFRDTVRAVAFAPALTKSDRAALLAYLSANAEAFDAAGYPDFDPFPDHGNDIMMPAVLVEPAQSREMVFGFDMASNTQRRSTALRAIETGQVLVTDPVVLSQDNGTETASVLLIAPVTRVPDRGLFASGVVAVGLSPLQLLSRTVSADELDGTRISFRFGPERIDALTLDAMGPDPNALWRRFSGVHRMSTAPIQFGGRPVVLDIERRYALSSNELVLSVLLGLTCLLATLMAWLYTTRLGRETEIVSGQLAKRESALRASERLIAQSQKQEALGKLVGGVAHDFNNILAVVMGNAELLGEDLSERERRDTIEQIKLAAERGSALSRQLLFFGRRALLEPATEEVGPLVQNVKSMLQRLLPANIELICTEARDTPPIFVDRNQLETALLNLAVNARDAMPDGGILTIDVGPVELGADAASPAEEAVTPGPYVVFRVQDTGAGMSQDLLDKAFDPFITTKPVGQGSGLGLSMVQGFARQSGGLARLESAPGKGTTALLYLPAELSGAVDDKAPEDPGPGERTAHILLSEDEALVREMLKRQLEGAGHRVTTAPNGETALRKLNEGLAPDILLTDIVMPGAVQGPDLAREAQSLLPGLKTIFISGYPAEFRANGDATAAGVVLQKPVRRADLVQAVAASIGAE